MKVYILIAEKFVNGSKSDVEPFTTKEDAETAMRIAWGKAISEYRDSGMEPLKEECFIDDNYAVFTRRNIINGKSLVESIETWKIRESELDIQVAVRVEDGLVQEAYSNADVQVEVYNVDFSEFPEDEEIAESDKREKEWEEETQKPGWRQVW